MILETISRNQYNRLIWKEELEKREDYECPKPTKVSTRYFRYVEVGRSQKWYTRETSIYAM